MGVSVAHQPRRSEGGSPRVERSPGHAPAWDTRAVSLAACQHCGTPLVVGAVGCARCGRYLAGDELSRGTFGGAVQTQLGTRVRAALLEGRYRLVEPIAVGRSSTVWRAHDTALDRPVAVKVLDEASAHSSEAVARFERRAQKLASVEHPAVVPVLAVGTAEPNPFLVMPLLAGVTLAEHLHVSGGALSPPAVAELVGTLCEAFAVLHATEHREAGLELRHVLVNADGLPMLLDAGLQGTGRGSTDALAPELTVGGSPSPRTDVYALGAVAVELLRGRPLVRGEALVLPDEVPAPLREVLTEALAAAPAARPASAEALGARLAPLREPGAPRRELGTGPTEPHDSAPPAIEAQTARRPTGDARASPQHRPPPPRGSVPSGTGRTRSRELETVPAAQPAPGPSGPRAKEPSNQRGAGLRASALPPTDSVVEASPRAQARSSPPTPLPPETSAPATEAAPERPLPIQVRDRLPTPVPLDDAPGTEVRAAERERPTAPSVPPGAEAAEPRAVRWVLVVGGAMLLVLCVASLWPSPAAQPPLPERLPHDVVRLAAPPAPAPVAQPAPARLADDLQQRREVVSPAKVTEPVRAPALRRGPGVAPAKMSAQRLLVVRAPLPLNLAEAEIVAVFNGKPVEAMLEVDGVYQGLTPEILKVPAGEYALRLQYKSLPVNEVDTNLGGGERIRLEIELQTLEGAAIAHKRPRKY